MAIDTIKKRASALNFIQRGSLLPVPDGEIDIGDKRHVAGFYREEFRGALNAQNAVTVWETETFSFDGEDQEWASVIITGDVYRVENDNGDFIWNSLGHKADRFTFEQGLDENTTVSFQGKWQPFNVTWVRFLNNNHIFTVEIIVEDECLRENKKMTEDLTTPLNKEVVEKNANPTTWEDFNNIHKRWNFTRMLGVKGRQTIMCQEDITDEPRMEDYPITGNTPVVTLDLRDHCASQIDSRINGNTALEIPLWSSKDHATSTYIRNTDRWCADIDLTSVSVWTSSSYAPAPHDPDNARCATLITPNTFIAAWHFSYFPQISPGDTFRFVGSDNIVYTRTVAENMVQIGTDLCVGILDSDLPDTITPAKVPPANIADYFSPAISGSNRVAAASLDQQDHATLRDLYLLNTLNANFSQSTDPIRSLYYESLITGDSSHPGFFIINGEMVVLTCWHFGGGGGGTPVHPNLVGIIDAIRDFGETRVPTIADLNGFITY